MPARHSQFANHESSDTGWHNLCNMQLRDQGRRERGSFPSGEGNESIAIEPRRNESGERSDSHRQGKGESVMSKILIGLLAVVGCAALVNAYVPSLWSSGFYVSGFYVRYAYFAFLGVGL